MESNLVIYGPGRSSKVPGNGERSLSEGKEEATSWASGRTTFSRGQRVVHRTLSDGESNDFKHMVCKMVTLRPAVLRKAYGKATLAS